MANDRSKDRQAELVGILRKFAETVERLTKGVESLPGARPVRKEDGQDEQRRQEQLAGQEFQRAGERLSGFFTGMVPGMNQVKAHFTKWSEVFRDAVTFTEGLTRSRRSPSTPAEVPSVTLAESKPGPVDPGALWDKLRAISTVNPGAGRGKLPEVPTWEFLRNRKPPVPTAVPVAAPAGAGASALPALGGASRMLGMAQAHPVLAAASAAAAVVQALVTLPAKLKEFGKQTSDANRPYSGLNTAIANSFYRLDLASFQKDIRMGKALQGSVSMLNTSQMELERSLEPYERLKAKAGNLMATIGNKAGTALAQSTGGVMQWIEKNMIDNTSWMPMVFGLTGWVANKFHESAKEDAKKAEAEFTDKFEGWMNSMMDADLKAGLILPPVFADPATAALRAAGFDPALAQPLPAHR